MRGISVINRGLVTIRRADDTPLRGLGRAACDVVGAASSRPSTYGNVPIDTAGCGHPALREDRKRLHFRAKAAAKRGAEAMQHFGEIFSAEIYARNAVDVGDVRRGKEVLKPWVSNGGSFGTFLSLLKEKYEHSA